MFFYLELNKGLFCFTLGVAYTCCKLSLLHFHNCFIDNFEGNRVHHVICIAYPNQSLVMTYNFFFLISDYI